MMMCVSSVYVAIGYLVVGIVCIRCSHQVAICSSMLYDVSRQGEQYSMYM